MSSPAPWNDARARLTAANLVAAGLIEWPNEPFQNPEPPAIWLSVDMTGDVLAPIELAGGCWQEEGRLYVHILTPVGWGSDQARAIGKAVANTFRGLGPNPVAYLDSSIGPGPPLDPDGAWWVLTVTVNWRYQDIAT